VLQINVTSTNTMETLKDLKPFTSYTCTLHAITVSDGPSSDPITVITAEQGVPVIHRTLCIDKYTCIYFL